MDNSQRSFPYVLERFQLAPYHFAKIIESVVRIERTVISLPHPSQTSHTCTHSQSPTRKPLSPVCSDCSVWILATPICCKASHPHWRANTWRIGLEERFTLVQCPPSFFLTTVASPLWALVPEFKKYSSTLTDKKGPLFFSCHTLFRTNTQK